MFHILNTITVSGELSLTDIDAFPGSECVSFSKIYSWILFTVHSRFSLQTLMRIITNRLIQHVILLFINSVSSEKLKLLWLKTSAQMQQMK